MRIGAVSYLNTKPLVFGLEELAPQHELVYDLPSRLADQLAAGELDVALIPSVEYFQNPGYQIISDACIACRGPVRSVKLLSRVSLEAIRTLALDEGSRTSAALVQILLRERFGLSPQLVPFPIDAAPESIAGDALLMIGDRAMHPPAGDYVAEWDLGDIWCRWSELPFVFAMWVSRVHERSEMHQADLATLLSQVRNAGVSHVEQIARAEHARCGLAYDDCLTYLRDHLHFTLGPRELAGLRLFEDYSQRYSLIAPLAGTKPGPGASREQSALAQTGSRFAPG